MSISNEIKDFKTKAPIAYQRVRQKIYKNVDRYCDYREIYLRHLINLAVATNELTKPSGLPDQVVWMGLYRWFWQNKHNTPTFFVDSKLLEACLLTDVTFDIDFNTMHFPFDSFNLVFPRGFKVDQTSIYYMDVARVDQNRIDIFNAEFNAHSKLELVTNTEKACQFLVNTNTGIFFKNVNTPYNINKDVDGYSITHYSPKLRQFLHKIPSLFSNILFAMAAKPELLETGRKISHHKKLNSEIWTPNIIGRKYTVKRPEGYEQGETGTHKRMHWRRGHFRHQPYGKGLTERKVVWLEPTLIGVKNAEG